AGKVFCLHEHGVVGGIRARVASEQRSHLLPALAALEGRNNFRSEGKARARITPRHAAAVGDLRRGLNTTAAMSPPEVAQAIRAALPSGGLFAGQTWRVSPAPFVLGPQLAKELESLGRVLLQFYRAVNFLYRQSVAGKQPPWIANYLDRGKPPALLELQHDLAFKNEIPHVIRPDILLTDSGPRITELDSVPGGIGLTGWLNQVYSRFDASIIGGEDGMINGFASIFGESRRVHLVVSEESA